MEHHVEHSKEFYQAVLRVIEYIKNGHRQITYKEGMELTGNYWTDVVELFFENHIGNARAGEPFFVEQPHFIPALYENCKDQIKMINKADSDRKLTHCKIWIAIICGVGGFVISLISLYHSVLKYL